MSYDGYSAIARVYDKLNKDIDYKKWADFFEECFSRFLKERPEIILDLACGTGRMTRELATRGYDMIGVDGSADMLGEAYASGGEGILYLMQDMRELELYGTVGATVCCLDSLNYLLKNEELSKTFALVHNYSDPDGLFIFDVNTPYKFENIYGDNSYVYELDSEEERFLTSLRPVSAFAGGVLGQTGIETSEMVHAIVQQIRPAAIIAIDALACSDISRLGTTIQICDAGISPGSGVSNTRKELSEKIFGIPVIAIGVPTVVDMHTIVRSLTGNDPDRELPNMMVTPRDIDRLTERASQLIAFGINLALQPSLSLDDVRGLF